MSATVAPAVPGPQETTVGKYWWLALVAGVFTMLIGIVALAYPEPTLLAVGLILGFYLVFWGTMEIVQGIGGGEAASTALRIVLVLIGLLSVLAGLFLLVRPGQSVLTAAWVLGFWWVLSGILQLARGFAVAQGRGWNIFLGLLGIVAGGIILAQPQIGLITLVWIVGFGLLLQGALEIAAGWQLRHLHKEGLA